MSVFFCNAHPRLGRDPCIGGVVAFLSIATAEARPVWRHLSEEPAPRAVEQTPVPQTQRIPPANEQPTERASSPVISITVEDNVPTIETPEAGKVVKISFRVKNLGHTPAHDVAVFAAIEYRDLVSSAPFATPVEITPGFRSELVRDGEIPIVVRTRGVCPDSFPASVVAKTAGVFITIEVRYVDDFGKAGTRDFRFQYDWRNLRDVSDRMYTAVQGSVA